MFSFFYSMFMALLTGDWQMYQLAEVKTGLSNAWSEVTNWVMNCLGGNFTALQTFTWSVDPTSIWALVLALVAITMVCVLVYKLIKEVFMIFFGGR